MRQAQGEVAASSGTDQHRFLPVAEPTLAGNEKAYVMDCLESTWISSVGSYVERFEAAFARFCSVPYAVA